MTAAFPSHSALRAFIFLLVITLLILLTDHQRLFASQLTSDSVHDNLLLASGTDTTADNQRRLMVHVKLKDHVLLTSSVLETLASLMKVKSYKQHFQFSSTESQLFTTRLSPQFIRTHLSNHPFIQQHVEWIKQVPKEYKVSFPQLTLESLKLHGELKILFDDENNNDENKVNHLLEKVNRVANLREWFHQGMQQILSRELLALSPPHVESIFSRMKSLNLAETFRFRNEIPNEWWTLLSQHSQEDHSNPNIHEFKSWLEIKLTEFFDLKFELNPDGHLHISLLNFDEQVWDRLEREQFSHPSVLQLARREDLQNFFQSIPELSGLWNSISNQMGSQLLDHLLDDPSVNYITRSIRIGLDNLEINKMVQNGGGNNHAYFWNYGITGEGEVLSYTDTGIDPTHCFFSGFNESYTKVNLNNRKIVYIDTQNGLGDYEDNQGHGTHVAGTLAGIPFNLTSNPSVNTEMGVAIGAKLYVVDGNKSGGGISFNSVSTYLQNAFQRANSCISSNSWGCIPKYSCTFDCICQQTLANGAKVPISDSECLANDGRRCCEYCNTYGYYGYALDSYLATQNDQVTLFSSAGNAASIALLGTIGGLAPSKNGIAVGSMYNKESMSSFSSRGPTVDGRIKPDIVTPGEGIPSSKANSGCSLITMSGTSMSCPAAAGSAGLIRHYFNKNNQQKLKELEIGNKTQSGSTLSGTLVKAMIIHSGEQMIGSAANLGKPLSQLPIPNNFFGFGRVNLQNVLKIDEDPFSVSRIGNLRIVNRMYLDVLDSVNFQFQTASTTTTVKVTIAWYDLPSSPTEKDSVKKLINDLDLMVTVQNSTSNMVNTFYGNGELTNNSGYDSVNTVESVTITSIPIGSFVNITVSAKSTNKGKQAFSMVVTGGMQPKTSPVRAQHATHVKPMYWMIVMMMIVVLKTVMMMNR
nr:unnamed protein product [Naegleria fowleri]